MKKFLVKFVIFLLPILTLFCGLEWSVRHIPNDYNSKIKYLSQHGYEIEVLALGSSHFYHGFNPDFMQAHAFNLAHIAQTPEFDLKLFQKFLPKLKNVKVLVYPISYFTFFWDLQSSSEAWRMKNYQIYYHVEAAQSFNDYFELLSISPEMNFKRIKDYYLKHKTEVGVTPKGWGFNCLAQYAANLEETAITSAQRHTAQDWNYYSKNTKEVTQILQLAQKNGMKVILVFPPAYKAYRNLVAPKQLQTTYLKIDSLLQQFPNTTFLDYFSDTTFTSKDFIDADHLNDQGAIKLTKKINEVVRF
jgi:predicted metal-dependent TIM-barrel fold hydrolase